MKILITILSIYVTAAFAKLPNQQITFNGPLVRSCQFVNDDDVIASLYSILSALEEIEEKREDCQPLYSNSKAYVSGYLEYYKGKNQRHIIAKNNKKILDEYILLDDNTGDVASYYQDSLLELEKEIAEYSDDQLVEDESLMHTLNLGSLVFEDLGSNPSCALSYNSHVLSPTISVVGSLYGAVKHSYDPLYGTIGKFVSSALEYMDRISRNSYKELIKLNKASNYYLQYKCALKNLDSMICKIKEKEENSTAESLKELEIKALSYDRKDDNSTYGFKELRDIERHRYRISSIVEKLEKIYNSPETAQDLQEIVILKTITTRLNNEPKFPPLLNEEYLKAMNISKRPPGVWSSWDKNKMKFSNWWNNYFSNSGTYLRDRVAFNCKEAANHPELDGVYDTRRHPICQPENLQDVSKINFFIKVVIVPSLVEFQGEIKRLNDKIKLSANVQNLYSEIISQEENTGDEDYDEFTLTELIGAMKINANKYKDGASYFFALDMIGIANAINLLLIEEEKIDKNNPSPAQYSEFLVAAKNAYSAIASISNNNDGGSILYVPFIESKISSYINIIKESFLYNEDELVSKNFVMFNFYGDKHRELLDQQASLDYEGSSNLSLIMSARDSFINVFGKEILNGLNKDIERYKSSGLFKREVLHSCALYYPYIDNKEVKGRGTKAMKKFCSNLIEKNEGLPYLKNDSIKYAATNNEGVSFKNYCYYHEYTEEAVSRKIYRQIQRKNESTIRF